MVTATAGGMHRRIVLIIAALLAISMLPGAVAAADAQDICDTRNNRTYRMLTDCVTLDGVRDHQAAFQAIADANDGTRSEGTDGYMASVDYVVETLTAAGWDAAATPFSYPGQATALEQLTPTETSHANDAFTGTGEGDVTGPVTAVDLALDGDRASTSGCEIEDFDGIDLSAPNDIVLMQRGACNFSVKADNALASGAEAIVIFNQGNTPDREGVLSNVTLGGQYGLPVLGASFASGVELSAAGSTARVYVENVDIVSYNVIAELPGRIDDNIVMAGAHLDSVPAGPGINDNGSGSAVLLEVAEQLSNHRPHNTVRFAWWGAEEIGLVGSTQYVNGLSEEELDDIALYLNFDMVGSPNYIFMTYDGDESGYTASAPVPEGSVQIEDVFESAYTFLDVPYDDAAFSGRSDYQAFINNGVPSGGLFTGAEVIKTAEQAAIWGGAAGDQYDPCYHQACDTFDNNSLHALDVNADVIAISVLTYAYSTESVNGEVGKSIPGGSELPEPAGPQGVVNN